jgi:hypothetical protein
MRITVCSVQPATPKMFGLKIDCVLSPSRRLVDAEPFKSVTLEPV